MNVIIEGIIFVDMLSISVSDIENLEWNQNLVNHLKSDDFFSADSFPISRLDILSSKEYQSIDDPQFNMELMDDLK